MTTNSTPADVNHPSTIAVDASPGAVINPAGAVNQNFGTERTTTIDGHNNTVVEGNQVNQTILPPEKDRKALTTEQEQDLKQRAAPVAWQGDMLLRAFRGSWPATYAPGIEIGGADGTTLLPQLIDELSRVTRAWGDTYPLFEFVQRLTLEPEGAPVRASLSDWFSTVGQQTIGSDKLLAAIIGRAKTPPQPLSSPYLFITIEPSMALRARKMSFTVRIRLLSDQYHRCVSVADKIAEKDLPAALAAQIDNALKKTALELRGATPTIAFCLPRQLLCELVEQHKMTRDMAGIPQRIEIGTQFPVVLRSLERNANPGDMLPLWQSKWDNRKRAPLPQTWLRSEAELALAGDEDVANFFTTHGSSDDVCLAIAVCPPCEPKRMNYDVLRLAMSAGFPIAFWIKGGAYQPQNIEQEITALLAQLVDIDKLPEQLLQLRKTPGTDAALWRHIALLWDDPNEKHRPINLEWQAPPAR